MARPRRKADARDGNCSPQRLFELAKEQGRTGSDPLKIWSKEQETVYALWAEKRAPPEADALCS
jgi:hypothetical protein